MSGPPGSTLQGWYDEIVDYNGFSSGSVGHLFSLQLNYTFSHGQVYRVETGFFGSVSSAAKPSGATSTATLDMAPGSGYLRILSITIT